MESNDLRIFQVVAYEKSISKAALRMGYVQSNVTLRIKILEEELGTTLLLRHNKGVTLTYSGEKLLVYADNIIRLLNEAEAAFKDNSSSLRIGATQTISASSVPRWLSKYSKKYPNVLVSLKTDTQRNLMEKVINGELDGAFINVQCLHHNISSVFTFIEELVIISSIDIKKIDELLKKPIIISNNLDCPYRATLEKWIIANKGTLSRIIEFDSLEAIIKCVANGMGISLLPKSLIKDNDRVYIHELTNEFNGLIIYFIKRNNLNINHPINNFINILSEV
ncbi:MULTISPECIES: LysR family transcriptional regulator [unclassified Clostridium]|uniref:LysR family transcriptional regulator n=1 Tax=unclassified Clostridium TaxID=2614128 RepID=UPI0002973D3F|nr:MULTISPECIES: LysR family transcriptional regulator [unclassified Clostridium]EKQ56130.1 MAG: transcriptional regulator [Clostridium sp. Maddingley MBC34-26]